MSIYQIEHQERYSRGELLLRSFFGWLYISIPHFFILFFLGIWSCILCFIAWWVVLFTGKYPVSFHKFNTGTLRWSFRVGLYLSFMTDTYPPFCGKEITN